MRSNGGVILKANKREKVKEKEKKNFFFKFNKKYTYISRNLSGAVAFSVGSVQFQIDPFSAYTSRYL